jgi:hypothetical protein
MYIWIMIDEIKQYINGDDFTNETIAYLLYAYKDMLEGNVNYGSRFGSVQILNTSVNIGDLDDVFISFINDSPFVQEYTKYYDRYNDIFITLAIEKTKEIASSPKFLKQLKQRLIQDKLDVMNNDFKS